MKEKLKPCPFCGCESIDLKINKFYIYECRDCQAQSGLGINELHARAGWQRRHETNKPR